MNIDLLINDFFEYVDLDSIHCVDDLIESLHNYFTIDLNIYNILVYYDIDDLNVLDNKFNASYDDDKAMDKKIEIIDNCIRLMMKK